MTCVVSVTKHRKKVGVVEIASRGVSYQNDEELHAEAQEAVRDELSKIQDSGSPSVEQLRKGARNALSRFLWAKTHTRPMVIPVVMEV